MAICFAWSHVPDWELLARLKREIKKDMERAGFQIGMKFDHVLAERAKKAYRKATMHNV
jgi:hypothetical protein